MNLEYEKIVFYCVVFCPIFSFFPISSSKLLFCPSLKFHKMET